MTKLLNSTAFHIILGCLFIGGAATFLSPDVSENTRASETPKILVELEKAEALKREAGTWSKSDEAMKSALLEATPEQLEEIERQTEAVRNELQTLADELKK